MSAQFQAMRGQVERVLKFHRRACTGRRELGRTARAFEALRDTGAVARYHHLGEWTTPSGRPLLYLAFSYLPGVPLGWIMRRRTWGRDWRPDQAARIILALTDRLARAHDAGRAVVDFEAGNNIILLPGDEPVFCDLDAGEPGRPNRDWDLKLVQGLLRRLAQVRPKSEMTGRLSRCNRRYDVAKASRQTMRRLHSDLVGHS